MLGDNDNDNDDDVIEEAPVSITTAISKLLLESRSQTRYMGSEILSFEGE